MIYSKYQENFFNHLIGTQLNIGLKATAGSGKTTTAVDATKFLPYGKTSLFCAFNKHIVVELKEKLPTTVQCQTLHSLGLRALFNHYPQGSVKIKDNKQIQFIEHLFDNEKNRKIKWSKVYETDKLLRLVRATMCPLDTVSIEGLAASHNLFPEQQIVEATIVAGNTLIEYNSDPEKYGMEVDFQDMIELCVKDKEIRMPKFDFVIVDECQDCSRLDQYFIEKLIKPVTGRLIFIGDPRQAIYSFRGADVHSFEYFESRPNTVTLPLSISYRCSKKIVDHAKNIYPEIEPWEKAREGKIVNKGNLSDIKMGDMVVSRTLRPLVEVFFSLVELGKKCTIVGKELEEGLLELLNHTNDEDTTERMNIILDEQLVRKENELSRRGITTPKNHPRYEALEEKISVLKRIARACGTIGAVKEMLESIFSDNSFNAIKLLSIHKSKGLEADRVFVIETFDKKKLIPNKYAVTKDQLVQERNLQFVAYTRAKEELIKIYL